MLWRAAAAASSLSGSRLKGVASTMLYFVTLEPNMAKPSWCLLVMTMYFIPASSASFTHSSALNFTGLNCEASCSYSFTGIFPRFMIHSPFVGGKLKSKKIRFGLYTLNLTNHSNPLAVYDNVTSPVFGHFVGFQHRVNGFVLDAVN